MRDWLKALREKKGFSIKQAAEQLDISESYYCLIENGERQKKLDFSLVVKLSQLLGVSMQEIATFEARPHNTTAADQ